MGMRHRLTQVSSWQHGSNGHGMVQEDSRQQGKQAGRHRLLVLHMIRICGTSFHFYLKDMQAMNHVNSRPPSSGPTPRCDGECLPSNRSPGPLAKAIENPSSAVEEVQTERSGIGWRLMKS